MKLRELIKIKVTSRRERMTYWLIALGFIMFLIGVIAKTPLLEVAAMYTPIAATGGWYINKETEKESIKEM